MSRYFGAPCYITLAYATHKMGPYFGSLYTRVREHTWFQPLESRVTRFPGLWCGGVQVWDQVLRG